MKRVNGLDNERISPILMGIELNEYSDSKYKNKEEAQEKLVGKQLTFYANFI